MFPATGYHAWQCVATMVLLLVWRGAPDTWCGGFIRGLQGSAGAGAGAGAAAGAPSCLPQLMSHQILVPSSPEEIFL